MELIIAIIAIVVIGAIWYVNRDKGLDVNGDSKVDVQDAKVAVENTVAVVQEVKEEVKEEVAEVKAAVKKTASKAKTATKKATTKKASTTGAKRGRKPKTGA